MSKLTIPSKLYCFCAEQNVVFPGTSQKIDTRMQVNIEMIEAYLLPASALGSRIICLVNDSITKESTSSEYNKVGIAAITTQLIGTNWPQASYTLNVIGLCRVAIEKFLQSKPYVIASISRLDKDVSRDTDNDASDDAVLIRQFKKNVRKFLELKPMNVYALKNAIKVSTDLDYIADAVASLLEATYEEKLSILNAIDLKNRLELLNKLLNGNINRLEKIADDPRGYTVILRMNPVTNGKGDERKIKFERRNSADESSQTKADDSPQNELLKKLQNAKMPLEVEKSVMEDYKRMSSMHHFMYEHAVLRNYLELVASLPWSNESNDSRDLARAKEILDEDHYGLDDVKKRILEYLAVKKLQQTLKGPILCFVGPPGVGKTSIGRSIARTLGRKFQRVSLGGICDQSDIRGHRRTYIGAMPGRIINGLKAAQFRNPVFLLDEVDKMSVGVHGDPSSALLEVLDPEQNSTFVDHYLNVPFDLSQVLFVATANYKENIPAPLYDRMEVIRIDGYTLEEKIQIGQKYLIPKQMKENGLKVGDMKLSTDILKTIISEYTWEAGVRGLERKLGSLMRAVALKIAEHSHDDERTKSETASPINLPIEIDEKALDEILGTPSYTPDTRQTKLEPGVAAGLCWTRCGGELMYVETSKMEGDGKVKLTGQLGEIMQESVHIALSWLWSHASLFNLNTADSSNLLERTNLHVHFPAGSVSKDGPSAGLAVVVALVSLFTDKPMRTDTAMTGEVTLRGQILAVGGLKEKILAAYRLGFSRVILPKHNEKDVSKIADEVRNKLKFIYVDRIEDALLSAFDSGLPKLDLSVPSKL